jgi:hypothetical protein
MGRIVVNKNFNEKSKITPESFVHKGEIIISNQVGYEGIFIKNNVGDIFYIGPTEGTGADVPTDYKDYIESFVNGRLIDYVTVDEFNEVIGNIQIDSGQVKTIVDGELTSYSTTDEMNKAINDAITKIEIPSTEGLATEEWVAEQIAQAQLSGGTDGPDLSIYVTEQEAQEIALNEILKVVDSADTSYDTLREIAGWIKNDTTSAASMANDIAALKSISADTRLDDVEKKLSGLTADDIYDAKQDKTQSEINQLVLQGSAEASKHFFMSTDQYAELVKNGSVVIDGQELLYDENAYYALYEPDEE